MTSPTSQAFTVRPLTPHEHPAVARILTETHPHDPMSVQDLERLLEDQARWGYRHEALVAVRNPGTSDADRPVDDTVLGTALYFQNPGAYHPHRYALHLAVDPQHQGQGIGAALWRELLARLGALGAESARIHAREDHPVAPGFLARRGGVPDHWAFPSTLDVPSFDPAPYAALFANLERQGVRLTTLAALRAQHTPHLNARLCALMNEIRTDVPRPEPALPLTQQLFDEAILGDFGLLPDGYVVAEQGGTFIGQSTLFTNGEGEALFTGLTGVTRPWRGRGLATAMKVRVIELARTLGAAQIVTDNASDNAAMLAVNERLGFARQPATASYLVRFR